jgi:hypothetical protein
MELNILKTNLLAIIGSGIAISLFGIVLFIMKEHVFAHMRYVLTIPPTGVAAYIFIFNLSKKYNGKVEAISLSFLMEAIVATICVAAIFFVFTLLMGLFISLVNHS